MITLPNGDKWIYDDEEWKKAGISYREACRGNIPETSYEEFINILVSRDDILPRKLRTNYFPGGYWNANEGYWNANFDVKEILRRLSIKSIQDKVFLMPWGEVVEVCLIEDDENCSTYRKYSSKEDYNKSVTL